MNLPGVAQDGNRVTITFDSPEAAEGFVENLNLAAESMQASAVDALSRLLDETATAITVKWLSHE